MGMLEQILGGMLGSQKPGGRSQEPSIIDALTSILGQSGGSENGLGGLLGGLTGGMGNSVGTATDANDINSVRPKRSGGLGGLLDSMTEAGHGDIADSWVSSGRNKPVAPHQLETALGGDAIDQLSRQTGIPRDQLLEQLSTHLPDAVDQLTPEGRRPTQQEMGHW